MDSSNTPDARQDPHAPGWSDDIFDVLMRYDVRQVAYVPDAGHSTLIRRAHADPRTQAVTLTTEEEGVALLAGAWLGGVRGVLLMQSSGVGNCVNMFSLVRICRLPLLMIVTMRGEWGEFNPWQVPMGSITEDVLRLAGLHVLRASSPEQAGEVVRAAATMAYEAEIATAVLLSQQLLGAKVF
jgi:sulfopyruvate decarboxylase alpha subunit